MMRHADLSIASSGTRANASLKAAIFFSLAELNVAIRILVDELDARLMRKIGLSVYRRGSSLFDRCGEAARFS